MEDIISRLLVSDSAVIQQASKELKAAIKNPSAIEELCIVIATSMNPVIRQYAAIVLRQRLGKAKYWKRLDPQLKERLTQAVVNALHCEVESSVVKILVQLFGTLEKHTSSNNCTQELLDFVGKLCVNADENQKLRGYFILKTLSEEYPDIFSAVLPNIETLVVETLQNDRNTKSPLVWHSLHIMKNIAAQFCDDQSVKTCFTLILPQMLKAASALSEGDEEMACELLDMIDDILTNLSLPMGQIVPVLNGCMEMASFPDKDDQVKIKALAILNTIVKLKKKALLKHNLHLPILQTLTQVLKMPCSENMNYDENNSDLDSPVIYASQVLDGLALNLPPGKLIPNLMEPIQILASSENPNDRKAAFLIMAVTAEGCAEYICKKCFKLFMDLLCKGLEDSIDFVKNTALYTLGQFAEHLQPDVGNNAEQLMPVLLRFLAHIVSNLKKMEETLHLDRVFYALEMFSEHSEKKMFLPYFPPLVENLLFIVKAKESSIHLKQLALSALGACVSNAVDSITSFVPQILECLSVYFVMEISSESICLQVQAIETMGVLAHSVPPEEFKQAAESCIRFVYLILENQCDPELEGSIYGLFGSISAVLKENMSDVMGPVIERMVKTLESSEGIVVEYEDDDSVNVLMCSDFSDSPDEVDLEVSSDEDDAYHGYCVENVYTEKKVAACYAVKELALNTGVVFCPYLSLTFTTILNLLNYPNDPIKKAALDALAQVCVNWSSSIITGQNVSDYETSINTFVQKCSEIIHNCDEKEVVCQALDSYTNLLKSSQNLTFKDASQQETIFNCILDVFYKRTLCQLEDDDSATEDDESTEKDELLIEYAGDLLPYFGRCLSPDVFKPYFGIIYPFLKARLKSSCTTAQRSFAIGILAECMEPLGPILFEFSNEIPPKFIAATKDEDSDVRNNAVYGLGEMLFYGKEKFFLAYSEILQHLSECLTKETVPRVIDNICGAVARMIVTNSSLIPLPQVFPAIMTYLPLKEDFKENNILMKCFLHLYEQGNNVITENLEKIIQVIIHVVHFKNGEKDTFVQAKHLFSSIQHDFPDRISALNVSPDMMTTFSLLLEK